jgi:hypothetical protein
MTLDEVVAGLRDCGRPDAAQALETRTPEEWAATTNGTGTGLGFGLSERQPTLSASLGAMFWWDRSPEGWDYWRDVSDTVLRKEGSTHV